VPSFTNTLLFAVFADVDKEWKEFCHAENFRMGYPNHFSAARIP